MNHKLFLIFISCAISGCGTTGSRMAANIVPPFFKVVPGAKDLYSPEILIGYTGEIKNLSEVAVLTRYNSIYIESINGNKEFTRISYPKQKFILEPNGNQLHLLPGTYDIEFCFKYLNTYGNTIEKASCVGTITKKMNLVAGQQISLLREHPTKDTWSIKERPMSSAERELLERNFNRHVLNNK